MVLRVPAHPIELHDPMEVFDRTAAKVFLNLEDMLRHPVGTYMARMGSDTRRTTERLLRIARDMLTDQQTSLKDFPWWNLQYQTLSTLRVGLKQRFGARRTNAVLGSVRGVLKECWRMGLMTHADYFRSASIESVRESREILGRYIRPPELERLFEVCAADIRAHGARDAAIFAVFYCTGLRTSELVALNIRDYDSTSGEIVVREGKFARPRRAFIGNEGKAALSAWIKVRGLDPGPLFVAIHRSSFVYRRRLARQHIGRIVRGRARDSGLGKVRPHDLRRSFISNLLDMGVDLLTVRKLAGHRSLQSTLMYDYRSHKTMQNAAAQISIPYTTRLPPTRPVASKAISVSALAQASALSGLRIGKYAWRVLDALQKHRWVTVTIPNDYARSSLGSAVRRLPHGLMCMPRRSEGIVYIRAQNKQTELRKSFAMLEKFGLVECEDVNLETGRHMPYAGYRITPLGRVTYRVACRAGLHQKRIELVRIRERLAIAIEKSGL